MMDDKGVGKVFEALIIHVAIIAPMFQAIATVLVLNEKIMKPLAKFVPTQVEKGVTKVGPSSVITAPPTLPSITGDSASSENEWKPR